MFISAMHVASIRPVQSPVASRNAFPRSPVSRLAVSRGQFRSLSILRAGNGVAKQVETVSDIMTRGQLITVHPETSIDTALELLVNNRITGLPVVDSKSGRVVGVVSDFDLLALDEISGKRETKFFPAPGESWGAFKEVQRLIEKTSGKSVADVMTENPLTVEPGNSIEKAARLLLEKKIRRLPVVDSEGRLVGILSRGNIVQAALEARKGH